MAYGSLIDDPGNEIKAATCSRIEDVETPFKVEFARSSHTRDGAPTLVPVEEGGAKVKAVVLVLKDSVPRDEAANLLWRRETRQIGSGKRYNPPSVVGPNTLVVEQAPGLRGVDTILYTKIAANIDTPTPSTLAELAIKSARSEAGRKGMDGISYLISAKQYKISTPLMGEYELEILRRTEAETLEEARAKCLSVGAQTRASSNKLSR